MGYNFRSADRDQQYLMPPSVRDWLPEGHLAWFVLDVVGELDLSAFEARYRPDGRGGAAYEPATMVALLLYAYCVGDRSSRLIERRLAEDVAYRVVAANTVPDHATVARFRAGHEDALAGLFTQVLSLCAAAGLVRVGVVALDGTKVEAAAATSANADGDRLRRALEGEARRILEEAEATDAAEDELYGDARGDELPPELADRSSRLRRLRAAKERLDAAQAERDATSAERAAKDAARGESGRRRPGRKPKADPARKPLLVNTTDPDSRLMKVPGGFAQAYNAQAVADEGQVLVAAELSTAGVDVGQLGPMLDAALASLVAAGVGDAVGTLLADAGYWSTGNACLDTDTDLLIATGKARDLPTEAPAPVPDPAADFERAEAERAGRIAAVLECAEAGELDVAGAAAEIGLSAKRTYTLRALWRRGGTDALRRRRRPRSPDPRTVARLAMEARLATDEGRALYRRRSAIVEPVFGQIKEGRGIRRFQRRGFHACAAEWKLIAATHNLLKLWRHRLVGDAAVAITV